MKYLSWDIGIKNLSYCLMDDKMNIIDWEVIDISGENKIEHFCGVIQKNKKICNKKATFYNSNDKKFYCNRHSKDFKENIIDIKNIKCSHKMPNGKICSRNIVFNSNIKFVGFCRLHSKHHLEKQLQEIKKDKGALDSISINLIKMLDDRPQLLNVDVITIENQPAFKNPKMKSIQMIIYTYFLIRGKVDVKLDSYIDRILFLSASNKLKVKFDSKKKIDDSIDIKNKYKKNTELAKLYCKEFLKEESWINFFNNNKKRDDLADTFLMNIYQIQIDNK